MISSVRVSEIFIDCFFKNEEIVDGKPITEPVRIEGIKSTFGLHPDRLKSHAQEVSDMIDELSGDYKNGISFLDMHTTKTGELWTGFHQQMEQLMVLGIATGKIEYCAPKEKWYALP